MVNGGVSREALIESFSKIREDIVRLNREMLELKKEQKELLLENSRLKNVAANSNLDEEMISRIVADAVSKVNTKKPKEDKILKKIKRNKKSLIKNRIITLAMAKELSLSEIKESIVDEEELCSKATFYRYVEKLISQEKISMVEIDERKIVVSHKY
ncbi:MAG: hypothetical protein KKF44_05565 [Nanoarchaeota archaeon]|nr:hypothetical protein [Nanoarchaeota archaeon]